jgi:threonine aldolase
VKTIDLRSDTVTKPTPEMRAAMANAEVGDDVFGEDPTVNRLEAMAADRLGMEAALLVTSGTMGNLVSLLTHCGRGDEAIVGNRSHTFLFEQGGMAALGGITPWPVPNQPDGTIRLDDLEHAIRGDNVHFPRTRLICLENTHNTCNGSALGADYIARVAELAHAHGLGLHIDGARIFNAAAALNVPVSELVRTADSVTFCLSKGLSAPVGSLICGSAAFIAEARRSRKVVGGGMRQAGVIAAAGIVSLEQIVPRLGDDHRRARRLAQGLAEIPGVEVAPVQTNILYFRLAADVHKTPDEVVEALAERGVRLMGRVDGRFRAVTHCWIEDEDIERAIAAMRDVMAG